MKYFLSFLFTVLLFSCTNTMQENNTAAAGQDTLSPPHIVVLANLPDSLQPKTTFLDTVPKPKSIALPTRISSFNITDSKGKTNKLNLAPPVKKLLPILLNPKGEPVKDSAGSTFIMGTGGRGNFTNFTTDNGLPVDNISCSIMDNAGNLWFGTFGGGVSRYDGKSFTIINVAQGLANNAVYSILEDKSGNLWFGTYGGGVSRYDGRTFTTFTTKEGLADNRVFSIMQDKAGNMWFGTAGGGASRYDGKSFKTFSTTDGLASNTIITIAEDKKGNIWFGTIGGGASRYDAASVAHPFTNFSTADGLAGSSVICVYPDKAGNIWFGTFGGGASRYDGSSFRTFSVKQGLAGSQVVCISEDRYGRIWFATQDNGVSCYDGKTFTSFSSAQGLAGNSVKSITEDRAGNLWFGTFSNGISRFNGLAFTNFSTAHGLANNSVFSIAEDNKGNIWLGTDDGGASLFDGKSFTTYSLQQGLPNSMVLCVAQDINGNIWFGTNGGLCRYDGKSFTSFTTAQGLAGNKVTSIAEDHSGNLWIGTTEGGVSRFTPSSAAGSRSGSFTNYTTRQGLANNYVQSIHLDNLGNLWFCTLGSGVTRYDGHAFATFTTAQGLVHDNVNCVVPDTAGNIWFATVGGLSVLRAADARNMNFTHGWEGKKSIFKNFTAKDGLPDNFVAQILQMNDGRMAAGTSKGINFFMPSNDLSQLNNIAIFNSLTGCPVKDINTAHRSMILTKKGIIWAGTGSEKSALVRFDPAGLHSNKNAPSMFIKGIKVNEENIIWHDLHTDPSKGQSQQAKDSLAKLVCVTEEVNSLGIALTNEERDNLKERFGDIAFDSITPFYPLPIHLTLPYSHNKITFEFNAIETGQPGLINYRCLLEGYDKDWGPVSKMTSATYGNIAEGSYTFKVKAQGPNAIWSEPVAYPFSVLPPWYRTWWAYAVYSLLFLMALVLFSKWRERSLRMDKERLEITVEKRTEELVQKNKVVETQKQEVEKEKQRSESLLLNILPEEIADELRNTGTTKAKQFDNVTVLFTDFVNFTQAVEQMEPQELINELDQCFRKFDEITYKYNIEKVKTIGDAYLAAAGLPTADEEHAEKVVLAAIEINHFMQDRKAILGDGTFDVRIGINSGAVIAGVVGIRKFAYDIWGDTVNTAARMEQSCEAGKINISEATYKLVKHRFACAYRGEQQVKGKGLLKMYYII